MGKKNQIRMHHLTDLHVGKLHYGGSIGIPVVPRGHLGHLNAAKYREYLEGLAPADLPDVVVISGDLTSVADEPEIDLAKTFIKNVSKLLLDRRPGRRQALVPAIVIVPGNHDLDWAKDEYDQKIRRYATLADDVYQGGQILSPLYRDPSKPGTGCIGDPGFFIGTLNDPGFFIGTLNTTRLGGTQDPVLSQLHKRVSEAYRSLLHDDGSEDVATLLAQLSAATRQDPGYVEPEDLKRLCKASSSLPNEWVGIRIAVMHHNLSSVPSDDIEAFDTIINAGVVKRALSKASFDIVLHGHRHFTHVVKENLVVNGNDREILLIGADAIGVKEHAPFLEIRIEPVPVLGESSQPGWLIRVEAISVRSPQAERQLVYEDVLSRPLSRLQCQVRRSLASNGLVDELNMEHLEHLTRSLQELIAKNYAWDARASRNWIKNFHYNLKLYKKLYATDLWERSSMATPLYHHYLTEQFRERSARLLRKGRQQLQFSPHLYRAIVRTRWKPEPTTWGQPEILEAVDGDSLSLELARILIRPGAGEEDRTALETLDYYHGVVGAPLFVISGNNVDPALARDFALGIGANDRILRSYAFELEEKRVIEVDPRSQGAELHTAFIELLNHPALQTVDQYLGTLGIMVEDKAKLKQFALSYDTGRGTNTQLLAHLDDLLQLDSNHAALDVGCGTGNYTTPFVNRVQKLIGLDISAEMLGEARLKTDRIEWVESNALDTPFGAAFFDRIWGISTLHYFRGDDQALLFREVHRLLKPGGIAVFDTELTEQYESLWVKHFFPSLRQRYKHSIFKSSDYKSWLTAVGFSEVLFSQMELTVSDEDSFLRMGQHAPRKYLNRERLMKLPAFIEMSSSELEDGLKALAAAIEDKSIDLIVEKFRAQATVSGDVTFIIARKGN
jgi:ubiquinone/menaquinone biosynthesis C-methylase UbiE/3',5'-cyclic AMP phosphodiesterase CpdA